MKILLRICDVFRYTVSANRDRNFMYCYVVDPDFLSDFPFQDVEKRNVKFTLIDTPSGQIIISG